MQEGDIEIINIDEPVGFESTGEDNLVLIFEINAEKAKSYCEFIDKGLFNCSTTLFYPSQTENEDQKKLKENARQLYDLYINQKDDIFLENIIREMIGLTCEKCHDLQNMFRDQKSSDVRAKRFVRIYTYIYENHWKKINLKELAESEYVSQQYLSKEFNDRLNMNFKDTLEYYRVINSVRYLITTKKTITMISELCGFSASRYFYKHFSLYLKCTPMEFRKKYLSSPEKLRELAANDESVQELIRSLKEKEEKEKTLSADFLSPQTAGDPWGKPPVYSRRKISSELKKLFHDFICTQMPPAAAVFEVKLQTMREQLHKLLYGGENSEVPTIAYCFYLKQPLDEIDKKKVILYVEQMMVHACRLGYKAHREGMIFHISYDILDNCREIRQVLELSDEETPLILMGIGYPA